MAVDISRFYFISKPFFDCLDEEELTVWRKYCQVKNIPKNTVIFKEGAYPRGIFILDKGKVKVLQNTINGVDQIITIHVNGEIFGYRPVLCDEKYPVSAVAIEDCNVQYIPKKHFIRLLNASSALPNILLRNLSYEFTVWVNTITNLGQRTVMERLLINLLILIEKYRSQKQWPVYITLSRADMASLIGTSNETLARLIKSLKDDRLIGFKGRTIVVRSKEEAVRIARMVDL